MKDLVLDAIDPSTRRTHVVSAETKAFFLATGKMDFGTVMIWPVKTNSFGHNKSNFDHSFITPDNSQINSRKTSCIYANSFASLKLLELSMPHTFSRALKTLKILL